MAVKELSADISDYFLGLVGNESSKIVDGEFGFGRIGDNKVDNSRHVHGRSIQIWHR